MGIQPKIEQKTSALQTCSLCHQTLPQSSFAPTSSPFYPKGFIPICDSCLDNILEEHNYDWEWVDKFCQCADIPFIPDEWERVRAMASMNVFSKYAEIFQKAEYAGMDWAQYNAEFKRLRDTGQIENELPELSKDHRRKQKARWGANYDDEALDYLDSLYDGLMATQNVNGSLQTDQAIKLCKISYEIDQRIAEGSDFDKLLSSYDKLVKIAEFTPRNVKNINDFDTVGELVKWMEKRGWRNKFYDDVPRDIVDETIMNFQNFNRKLYLNESGIGDEITNRLQLWNSANQLEKSSYYDLKDASDDELDRYDTEGYDKLFEEEEFDADA